MPDAAPKTPWWMRVKTFALAACGFVVIGRMAAAVGRMTVSGGWKTLDRQTYIAMAIAIGVVIGIYLLHLYLIAIGAMKRPPTQEEIVAAGPSLKPCPRCAYNLADLDEGALCPECAYPMVPPEPPPVGRPVCARCGTNMRGREKGRTCPDCGVMYGVTYLPDVGDDAAPPG